MPTSALAGQLYSTDFFRLALSRLKPGGYVVQWMPSNRTLASFLRVFPYVVRINFMLVGSADPINIADRRLDAAMAGPAGDYLAGMGWNRDEVAPALVAGSTQSWSPGEPRDDRDVNTDLFPKDEYHWIGRKIDLLGGDG